MASVNVAQEWAPTCFLIAHSETANTTIHFAPRHICRREARYYARLRIYDRSLTQPVWTGESGECKLGSIHAWHSADIAKTIGKPSFMLYGEADAWSPDYAPAHYSLGMGVHAHYASTDATFRGQIAGFSIYGVPRIVVRGDYYYENFPAVLVNDRHRVSVFSINPFLRSTRLTILLIHEEGVWESAPVVLRGKSVIEWKSVDCGFPGSEKPLGLVVKSELKTTSFFATRDAEGRMLGLDHGHPFLSQVLSH